MKKIFTLFLLFNFAFSSLIMAQSEDSLRREIEYLLDENLELELKLNYLIFDQLIESYELSNQITPTAVITLDMAKIDPRIDSLRKSFEEIDGEILRWYMADSTFRKAYDEFDSRGEESQQAFFAVKKEVAEILFKVPIFVMLMKERDRRLYVSNMEALKLYVDKKKQINAYIDFKLDDEILKNLMTYPAVKRLLKKIEFNDRLLEKKNHNINSK